MTSRVYVATVAVGDDRNDPGIEIVGVFTTEQAAWDAAAALGPYTAAVECYELDAHPWKGEPVRWMEDGQERRP